MPIVLSYEDVGALGALAASAGSASGMAARADRDFDFLRDQQRLSTQIALDTAQRRSGEQQAELDRQLRGDLAAADLMQRQTLSEADLAQRQYMADRDFEERQILSQQAAQETARREALEHTLNIDRDRQRHSQRLEEIRERARTKGTTTDPRKAAEQAARKRQELLPVGQAKPGESDGDRLAARNREAEILAGLSNQELADMYKRYRADEAKTGKRHPAAAYIAGLLVDRHNAGQINSPNQPGAGAPLSSGGRGLADPVLGSMSDADLMELARNPAMLGQLERR